MGLFKIIWSLSGQDQVSPHLSTPSKYVAFLPLFVKGIVGIHWTKGAGRGACSAYSMSHKGFHARGLQ